MKSLRLFVDKVIKKENVSHERLEKNRVRAAIENVCQEYLLDFNDVLTFESLPNALDNTLAVVEEPYLTSKYEFEQINETLFRARLKELNVM